VRLSENELSAAQLSTIPLDSIERIEVVRGSGAVLYGGGASGGTVNIITRRGQPGETRAEAIARAGGYGTAEIRAGYRRMGEAVGLSLDASHEETAGYRRNNRFKQSSLSGLLESRDAGGRTYLRVSLGRQDLQLPGALTEAQIAADPRQAGAFIGTAARDDATVTLGRGWTSGRHEWAADLSYRSKDAPARFPGFAVDTRVGRWAFVPRGKLRFDAMGREHDATVGMDVEKWDYDSRNTFGGRTGEQANQAIYGLANLWIAERSRLVLGARLQNTDQRLGADATSHGLSAYEAALRQRIAAGWSVYGKLASSFRLATFDEICFFSCANSLLKPQTARAGELGLELERRGRRLRAAIFETRLENEIYFSPLAFDNVNLPPTRRRGLELEGAWSASPTFEWRAAAALQQARFRDTGKDVPLVPEAIATAGLSWSFAPRTRFNLNSRFVGRQRYDNDQNNEFRKQPAYGLVDLKMEHTVERLNVALEIRNLFDKNYYSYGIWDAGASFAAYPQPERAAYLSLVWRLD